MKNFGITPVAAGALTTAAVGLAGTAAAAPSGPHTRSFGYGETRETPWLAEVAKHFSAGGLHFDIFGEIYWRSRRIAEMRSGS